MVDGSAPSIPVYFYHLLLLLINITNPERETDNKTR